MKNNSGFSLLEMLVTMVIVSVLLSIAAISGSAWLKQYQVESQTKQLYTDLMNARAQAMQRNRTFFVVMAATQYTIYEDTNPGPDGDGVLQPANDTRILQKSLNANYSLTIPPVAATSINFEPKGLASMSPGLIGPPPSVYVPATIFVTSRFNAAYDCIVIEPMRTTMGAWNGANCVVK
jgi:prepilin-type N-terminal cleavage/methylation domain-containing protein